MEGDYMGDYEKMCRDFVEYMGGDINSDEYKFYLMEPFSQHIFNIKIKEIQTLKAQLKEANEVIGFYANEDNWHDCWIDGCAGSEDFFTNIFGDMGGRVGGFRAREYQQKYVTKRTQNEQVGVKNYEY